METQIHPNNSAGNGIAFLFGVMFNFMTNANAPGTGNYIAHAIAGGIICLFFKMMGDLFTPILKSLGEKLKSRIDRNQNR